MAAIAVNATKSSFARSCDTLLPSGDSPVANASNRCAFCVSSRPLGLVGRARQGHVRTGGRAGRPAPAPRAAAERGADGGAALHPGSRDAVGELRQRRRPWRRTPRSRRGWGGCGAAAGAGVAGADRALEALRPELASRARPDRYEPADARGESRPGPADRDDDRQPGAARCGRPNDGAGRDRGAVCADPRQAGRSPDSRRGHERAACGGRSHRRDEGHRAVEGGSAARQRGAGAARGDRGRPAAHRHGRMVLLLQRLRPVVHLVDGWHLRQGRRGAQGLRGAAARQGGARESCRRSLACRERAGCRGRGRRLFPTFRT